jgi:putative ABC transport system permease protein
MFKLNLKIALRNLWKNKGYSLINILGLSIGMACCMLIFIFIHYQTSFDNQFKYKDRIFRPVSNWTYNTGTDASNGVPIPFADAMRNDFPQLKYVAAVQSSGGVILVKDEQHNITFKENIKVQYIQPNFFRIFDFNWLTAKPALTEPNTVVISEEQAIKYFGAWPNAMGKTILFMGDIPLKITGIFKDLPGATSLPIKIAISYSTYWNKNSKNWGTVMSNSECYVLLKEGFAEADLAGTLEKFNDKYKDDKESGRQYYSLQPLKEIHYDERYGNIANKTIAKKEIYGLSVIGLFLIITACINFINLATAQAINRSKEVGIRKVMGSRRKQLIFQFLLETLTITIIALLIASVLAELALPYMQNLFQESLVFSLSDQPVIFLFMICLVIMVTLLAGFYPALIMSGFNPALALKNKVNAAANGLSLRKILVVVQFAITIILIIGTLVVLRQMDYLRQKPLGFEPTAVALVNMPGDSLSRAKYNSFKEQLLQLNGVQLISFCQDAPSSYNVAENSFSYAGKENKDFQIRVSIADENYFKLFNLKILSGKVFRKSDSLSGYVVNETFLKKMNISNPQDAIGKLLSQSKRTAPIVGVVKDFNDKSLKESISPIAIYADKNEYWNLAIKIDESQIMPAMKSISALWNKTYPDQIYDASFVDDNINNFYESERIMGVLFKVFASVIIFISFIGLFGLISFVAAQRTKEVAIRKVLGASTYELVSLLNGSFLLMVFLANLIAWPLAYILTSKWLSGFVYRIELSVWPFAFAMLISMLITLVTVSMRSYRAAVANTIDALKYE